MQQPYTLNITYTPGQTIASWNFGGAQPDPLVVQPGDKINFIFQDQTSITQSVLISGPLDHACPCPSPFEEGNGINLLDQPILTVGGDSGRWGFTVSFAATGTDGSSSFYFLPDPELQVGTTDPDPK